MHQSDQQNNLYFTMWYGVVHRPTLQLTYASGGHPPAILVTGPDRAAARVQQLPTPGRPIGTFSDSEYPTRQARLQAFNRLFVFSDGAYEIVRPDDSVLTLEEFIQHLADRTAEAKDSPQATLAFLEKVRGSTAYEDDLALVEISFLAPPLR